MPSSFKDTVKGKPPTTLPASTALCPLFHLPCQPKMYMDGGSFSLFANSAVFPLWSSCPSLLRDLTQKEKSNIYLWHFGS